MKDGLKLLVAEDRADDVFLLQRAFTKSSAKCQPSFVKDGQDAVDYLQGAGEYADRLQHPLPTVLLLDLQMPRLNGFEVLEWIKSEPSLHKLVVVIFSSSDNPEDVERAYDLGANSYVVKPTEYASLPEVIRKLDEYWCGLNEFPSIVRN